jgi:phosphate:Na+ symporter
MTGHTILLNVLGGIALLIWATRMVRTGVLRAFGDHCRHAIGKATRGSVLACVAGVAVSTAVQSSSATGLIAASFVDRGLISVAAGLAVMLGADLGSTFVVQALSLNLTTLAPVLLAIGVSLFLLTSTSTWRQLGRIAIGLGLILLSLAMIVGASQSLRESTTLSLVLSRLADDTVLAFLAGILLTWLVHSSVATILLFMSLAGAGVIGAPLAIVLVIGANVGSGLIPLGFSLHASAQAKRLLVGNLAFRLAGAIVALTLLAPITELLTKVWSDPARQIANLHTAFNLALVLAFLPFTAQVARVSARLFVEGNAGAAPAIKDLDDTLLDRPALALGCATREVMRLADLVEIMLRGSLPALKDGTEKQRQDVKNLDDEVDRLQEELKLYLTRLTRQSLSEDESRRAFDLILFTTNLEHVGDIIDKSFLQLAAKKSRLRLAFSPEGLAEIEAMHRRVVDQMRLAMTIFVSGDVKMARELVAEKDRIRLSEREATQNHLRRLREGTLASIETSSLHLDILRDLKRINAHITSIAYPILESTGELSETRLRWAAE